MILIVLIAVALGGVLVWALYTEDVPARQRPAPRRLDLFMTGRDVVRHDAPLVIAGYDPRRVDAHLRQVAAIHDRLRSDAAVIPADAYVIERHFPSPPGRLRSVLDD